MFEKFFELTFKRGKIIQQGASEFLAKILDRLSDEDVKRDKRGTKFIEGTGVKENEINNLFFSLLKNTITPETITKTCKSTSRIEGINKLDLAIKKNDPAESYDSLESYEEFAKKPEGLALNYTKLSDCLQAFIEPELLTDKNKYQCSDGTFVNATKQFKIKTAAPFLIIALKRFADIQITGEEFKTPIKLSHRVSFPLYNLDLKPYMSDDSTQTETKYDLISFVQQRGSLRSGHYTSWVRSNGEWYYCNDTNIQKRDEDEKDIENIARNGLDSGFTPYILFYKRKDIPGLSLKQNKAALSELERQLQSLAQRAEPIK